RSSDLASSFLSRPPSAASTACASSVSVPSSFFSKTRQSTESAARPRVQTSKCIRRSYDSCPPRSEARLVSTPDCFTLVARRAPDSISSRFVQKWVLLRRGAARSVTQSPPPFRWRAQLTDSAIGDDPRTLRITRGHSRLAGGDGRAAVAAARAADGRGARARRRESIPPGRRAAADLAGYAAKPEHSGARRADAGSRPLLRTPVSRQ